VVVTVVVYNLVVGLGVMEVMEVRFMLLDL
jgi:hypothetical protein